MSGTNNRTTNTHADMEQNIGNAPLGAKEITRFDSPVHVHFHSIRKRLADIDGISGKACLDAIVRAGILPDDTPEYVKAVSHTQEKGKIEKTIVTITEI